MFGKLGRLLLDDTSLAAASSSSTQILESSKYNVAFAPIAFHAHPITGPKKPMKHHLCCPEGELFPDISRESFHMNQISWHEVFPTPKPTILESLACPSKPWGSNITRLLKLPHLNIWSWEQVGHMGMRLSV